MKKSIITDSRGFSLLELITVAAIIALIAGFFYPYLLVSTMTTNEKTAVATIRTIFQAQIQYAVRNGTYGALEQLVSQEMLDESLRNGLKSGYRFWAQNISDTHFEVIAVPQIVGKTGKGFFIDGTSVVRYSADGSSHP
ncbi:prepilin-type N-terminal cleavage/methylation domain-containing protein [Acidobacteria bacterium AH-259-A15]|nr:prepilin-type N-terminal cleavage/methylation domain-containing protein [Acidobacteria bacterium AH-259-A15]